MRRAPLGSLQGTAAVAGLRPQFSNECRNTGDRTTSRDGFVQSVPGIGQPTYRLGGAAQQTLDEVVAANIHHIERGALEVVESEATGEKGRRKRGQGTQRFAPGINGPFPRIRRASRIPISIQFAGEREYGPDWCVRNGTARWRPRLRGCPRGHHAQL